MPGALWTRALIEAARPPLEFVLPDLVRVVVAIDPAASSGEDADETGILVAGQDAAVIDGDFPDWRATIPPMPAETQPETFSFVELKKFDKVRRSGSKLAVLRIFAQGAEKPALV